MFHKLLISDLIAESRRWIWEVPFPAKAVVLAGKGALSIYMGNGRETLLGQMNFSGTIAHPTEI